jgi:acyl-CoA hydrolase
MSSGPGPQVLRSSGHAASVRSCPSTTLQYPHDKTSMPQKKQKHGIVGGGEVLNTCSEVARVTSSRRNGGDKGEMVRCVSM